MFIHLQTQFFYGFSLIAIMDIVSRLKLFLAHNGISNSTFADTCDIPRPTLSQLLNGRNKKVSDELITKIHNAYPALSVMWLMFGDGDMFVPNANSMPSPTAGQVSENPGKFSSSDVVGNTQQPVMTSISFSDDEPSFQAPPPSSSPSATPVATISAALQNMAKKTPASASSSSAPAGKTNGGAEQVSRCVTSIMVFYSDNSFEEFVPRGAR